jgi:hypothetical protein
MDKIEIIKQNGKWLVNGKSYIELDYLEKLFFDEFILAMKWEKEMEKHDQRIIK